MLQTPQTAGGQGSPATIVSLIPGVTFSERDRDGCRTYVCHHGQHGRYFHFGPAEYEAARLLDGSLTLPQVLQTLHQCGVDWSPEELSEFVSALIKHHLAHPVEVHGKPAPQPSEEATTAPRRSLRVGFSLRLMAGILSQRIPLFQADPIASRLAVRFGWLFRPKGVCLWLLTVLSAAVLALLHRDALGQQLKHFLSPQSWPWMLLCVCLIKVAHEAGHAVAARRQGVRVGQAGLVLFMLAPLLYVNVTDAWRLPRRWARMQIGLAGVYIELLIAGLAVWVWHISSAETTKYVAAQVALLAGPATLLVNANPLLRLDGYYVLSDWLQIPNLRMHGRKQVGSRLEHWLLGRRPQPSLLDPVRARAASIHAVLSVGFQVIWMSGLVLAASAWAEGLGIILAILATLFWLVLPLLRWVHSVVHADDWQQVRTRFVSVGALAIAGGVSLGFVPSPWGRRIPVVIRYQNEQIARASTDGFVQTVYVRLGDAVAPGDLLVEMDAPDLKLQCEALGLDCQASRLRARQLSRKGDLAMADAELERWGSLRRQHAELERQVEALKVKATRRGIVTTYQISDLMGQYLHRGDVLLKIGDESRKEVLASIAGSDLDAYLASSRSNAIQSVRLRGGRQLMIHPQRPQPRVSSEVPHSALASTAGGPLPVEMAAGLGKSSTEGYQLTAPRCRSISVLDEGSSRRVHVGQQGVLIIGDTRSIWDRVSDRIRDAMKLPSA